MEAVSTESGSDRVALARESFHPERKSKASLRKGNRHCLQLVYLRRGSAHLLEQHAAGGRAVAGRSTGRPLSSVGRDCYWARISFHSPLARSGKFLHPSPLQSRTHCCF